jgi:hypothetical protein
VPLRRLTRRQTLHAGAAALAVGVLPSRAAFAASRPSVFELALGDDVDAGWRLSRVYRAPRRFDLIGLRWSAGGVDAEVRVRRGGSWGEWLPLHRMHDHGPDRAEAVLGTEPAYTGPADHFQLRLRGSARGLRARFVHAQPAARAARASATRAAASGRARGAQASLPRVISRGAWGGDAYPPRVAPEYGSVQMAFVHHTVSTNAYRPQDSAGIVLGICRFHRNSNGWNDLGYNFLVDRYGQVFEGRAGGIDQPVIGAQAQGYNAQSLGIAFIGNSIAAPEAALDAISRVIGWKLSRHGVPATGKVTVISAGGAANRYAEGTPVILERVSGHRDGDTTTCPGGPLYAQLPEIRRRAARYASAVGGVWMRAEGGPEVRHPEPLLVTGGMRRADGTARAGLAVTLEWSSGDGVWLPLGRATTDATGVWSADLALPGTGTVRASYAPEGLTALLSVYVEPLATVLFSTKLVTAGAWLPVTGTYAPNPAPLRAQVVVERLSKGRYTRDSRQTITVRGGRYGFRLRLRKPGTYRVSVVIGATRIRRTVRVLAATRARRGA